jgi:hypothetical protein
MKSKTELKKNIIRRNVFNREIAMCQKLSKDNGGKCGWGICKNCGVIPFLYKLHKGQLLEDSLEINKIKSKILN